jgi:hypothetical protein
MDKREPAWQILPATARCVLAIIETAIRSTGKAQISKRCFEADHGIGRGMLLPSLKRLHALGFLEIQRGVPAQPSVFTLSDRWKSIGLAEAQELVIVARKRKPRMVRAMKRAAALQQQAEAAAKQSRRRHFGDDHVTRRLAEGVRARPAR